MKRNIVILGPTASGKTLLSIEIARYFNLPIINVDTRQFWQDITILTASPSQEELNSAQHILFNNQNDDFFPSLGWWKDQLKNMEYNSKIIVGGNAFYINNLRRGIVENIDKCDTNYTWNDLYNMDNNTKVHANDHYRIQRHMQFYLQYKDNYEKCENKYSENVLIIAIIPDKKILYERICQRTKNILQDCINEVKNIKHNDNYNNIIGYKEIQKYLNNMMTYDELYNEIILRTYQYAKKQLKFLKSIYIDLKINNHILTKDLIETIQFYLK